jgi:hypothetical protein
MSVSETIVSDARKWHGSISEKISCISNLIAYMEDKQSEWAVPKDMLDQLTDNRNRLVKLIDECRSVEASKADRERRNALFKSTSDLCLMRVKQWVYGRHSEGVITTEDVHLLRFLIPGENGGFRKRKKPVDVTAYVKVKVINADIIRVITDQSDGHNSALMARGWPRGIRHALIVIMTTDGKTEVRRLMTTRMHCDIHMPEGSHGRQFVIKASFMAHSEDDPRFGNELTFSMPLTTEDLAAGVTVGNPRKEEADSATQEIERLRREIERLQAELSYRK